jgi:HECT-domain (ubiquitin-transferase)
MLTTCMQVTNENKREYAQLAAREKMTTSIREAVDSFQRGMWEIVPLPLLRIFTHAELELLISGLPDIDVADLRRNTVYGGGLSSGDRLSQWFWSLVEEMDKQDVALLLQFVTGTSHLPCPLSVSMLVLDISFERIASAHRMSWLHTVYLCFHEAAVF